MPILENPSNAKHTRIGCMSGIFHFLSRHTHNSSRKRLSSAERRKKTKETPINQAQKTTTVHEKPIRANIRIQRSPTLPSEIRRSSSVELSLESPRRPTPLVVKLMGLDEMPVTSPNINYNVSDLKRRKLLSALEKCDSDLKSLKKIIDAVSEATKRKDEVMLVGRRLAVDCECESSVETLKSVGSCDVEQPSPVSVLDAVSSPSFRTNKSMSAKQIESSDDIRSEGQDQHFSTQFTSGSHEKIENEATEENYQPIFHQITTSEKLPRVIQMRNQAELQLEEFNCLKRVTEARSTQKKSERSNAVVETVNEICKKGTKEQSMEIARVTFGIERGIFSDLVDDIVKDFSNCCFKMLQGSCRKRLCF